MTEQNPTLRQSPTGVMILAAAVVGLTAMSGCKRHASGPEISPNGGKTAQSISEADSRIFDVAVSENAVSIRVPSNGCTEKDSFNPLVLPEGSGVTVIFRRIRPDLCRAFFPDGIDLTYSRDELGIERGVNVSVMNPRID